MSKASQYLPFDGLRGWKGLIQEADREKEKKRDLSEDRVALLDAILHRIKKNDQLRVTYFDIDTYRTIRGWVTDFDPVYKKLRIDDTIIRFDNLWDIEFMN